MKKFLILILMVGVGSFIVKQQADNLAPLAELELSKGQLLTVVQEMLDPEKKTQPLQPSPNATTSIPTPLPAAAWLWDPNHKSALDRPEPGKRK